ncbi:MAG: Trp biosynthesis-associated membrane protein [Nocardioides sp.]|uniref:Trp biosynthesis-associated membrane protein n=1 Tax=Nocardioides sp. TaxID=35761 RepID=UPI0039E6FBE3
MADDRVDDQVSDGAEPADPSPDQASDDAAPGDRRRSRRRSFGPVVLVGLVGAGAAAMAGSKDWVSPKPSSTKAMLDAYGVTLDAPAVTALALVSLAAWGAALVTRGWVRRVILLLAALAALVNLPIAVQAARSVSDTVTGSSGAHGELESVTGYSWTPWPWFAGVGLVLTLVAAVLGVLLARSWPEMGSKYDAPAGAAPAPAVPLEEQSNLELWKALEDGRDPTQDATQDATRAENPGEH